MNRTRKQSKAAKARKDWELLQEQKLVEETSKALNLKKVKDQGRENSLWDYA